ncbi:MAG: trimeric autotransporter adhesin [Solirubrobacterales bacterium]|jgi:hypothetical protein|nr:trimeric autotransporter adhesin [Solirubrobacterales bacterium]
MRLIKCATATAAAVLCLAATAGAAPVTVGSPLTGAFTQSETGETEATLLDLTSGEPGAHATSPVTGAVVRWHLLLGAGGPFTLRVLHPVGGSVYSGVGSSAPVVASGGLETFSTALPIQAGDTVGLDIPKNIKLGVFFTPTSSVAAWVPPLLEGTTRPYSLAAATGEYGFNAVVQPQPTVALVSPASGSFKGGSAVTIAGTDFAAVSAVKFGANPATSFTVGSEGQITAVAPAGKRGAVDITVTTVAGTSPVALADQFTYTACLVPRLKDKKLKAAKKKLRKAGCKVGVVKRKKGVTAKAGEVVKQSRNPGGSLPPGTKVNITLG